MRRKASVWKVARVRAGCRIRGPVTWHVAHVCTRPRRKQLLQLAPIIIDILVMDCYTLVPLTKEVLMVTNTICKLCLLHYASSRGPQTTKQNRSLACLKILLYLLKLSSTGAPWTWRTRSLLLLLRRLWRVVEFISNDKPPNCPCNSPRRHCLCYFYRQTEGLFPFFICKSIDLCDSPG